MDEAEEREASHRGRPADPQLEGRFIQAALDLLTERGYRALTTAAIARRAGASTASLYRRWPTKRALVSDIARTLTLNALGGIDTGSLEGDLREFIRRKRSLIKRVGTPLILLLAESAYDDELREILRPEVIDATARHLYTLLARASSRGAIPAPSLHVVRTLSMAVLGSELISHALSAQPGRGFDGLGIDDEAAILMGILNDPVVGGEGRNRPGAVENRSADGSDR